MSSKLKFMSLVSSLRQQRGHHHAARAGPPKGADGDVSYGICQVVLRDSAASDDTQPRGESTETFIVVSM